MAAAFVKSTFNTSDSGSVVTTSAFGSSTANTNAILVTVYWDGGSGRTLNSVTDSKGNTYTLVGSLYNDANNQAVQHAYFLNLANAGTSHTVTATLSSTSNFVRVIAFEVSGLLASGAFDQESGGKQQTGTSVTDNAVVPTNDGQFIFASCMNDGGTASDTIDVGAALIEPANSTSRAGTNEAIAAYAIQTTATSISSPFTRTNSGSCLMRTSTFKSVADGGTVNLTSTSLAVPVPVLGTSALAQVSLFALGDYAIDLGLNTLNTLADKVYVCSSTPTTFNEATLAPGSGGYALGSKDFGVGAVFTGSIAAGSPAGRKLTSDAVTNGLIATNGTVMCWAIVDSVNSRLLARGPLTGGTAVTAGQGFTLEAIVVHMNS